MVLKKRKEKKRKKEKKIANIVYYLSFIRTYVRD